MGKLARPKISETLIGVGDSHLDNFTFFCAATCRIPGATAYGLANPESETNARKAFINFIESFPSYIPLLCVGEVDCNSLPWLSNTYKQPELSIMSSIQSLFQFTDEFNKKFILPSVILPPVESFQELTIRKHVSANKIERTELVKFYNLLLKEGCDRYGHCYLDITTPTTNIDGFVNETFIRSSTDVHLMPHKVYNIINDILNSLEIV